MRTTSFYFLEIETREYVKLSDEQYLTFVIMMHLKFPRYHGFLHWDELGCLARALGFHENLFVNNLPEDGIQGREGVTIKELHEMFDFHKYFNKALDRTSNIHTDEWNIHTIKKTVSLLDKHVFTFEEIKDIRLAYAVYESSDTRGMPVNEKTVQRAIKMCGRVISPQKMLHRIKHMSQGFDEPDHIQLHEFLDLLLWCQMYESLIVQAVDLNVAKDQRELFELEDFEALLTHYDQRLASDLDVQYKRDELRFVKEKFGSKRMPKDVPPVDQEIRKKQVKYHNNRCKGLHREIGDSTKRVNNSRAGYVRDRPISAPDLTMYEHIDASVALSALEGHQTSAMEMFGFLIRPRTSPESGCTPERPKVSEYRRPATSPMVQHSDKMETSNSIDCLQYEMETLDTKYRNILVEDMDFLLPGYRQRLENRPKSGPDPPPPMPRPERRPTQETLRRLSTPIKYGPPLPSHARTCDARFRGWHKVKSSKGAHYILAGSSFDSSPNGRLLQRLRDTADKELKREPVIYRYTRTNQLGDTRPQTSPADFSSFTPNHSPRRKSSVSSKKPDENVELNTKKEVQVLKAEVDKDQEPLFKPLEVTEGDPDAPEGGDVSDDMSDASSVVSWSDLAVYHNNGDDSKENLANETNEVNGNFVMPTKTRILEDIKETEEEGSSQRSVRPLSIPGNLATNRMPGIYQNEQGHYGNSRLATLTSRSDSDGRNSTNNVKKSDTVKSSPKVMPEYVDPWFTNTPHVARYQWVGRIMSTDYTHRQQQQRFGYDYCRLSQRGNGEISRHLKHKLSKGIAAS